MLAWFRLNSDKNPKSTTKRPLITLEMAKKGVPIRNKRYLRLDCIPELG